MAGVFTDVNGVNATLFKETEPPIYLLPDGRFAVRYGGLWKIRGSVAPLLKLIGRYQAAVKMMANSYMNEPSVYGPDKMQVIEAVSWDRGIIGTKDGKRNRQRRNHWYRYDAKLERELNDLYLEAHRLEKAHAKAYAVIVKKHLAILKRLKPVTEATFRTVIAGLDEIRKRSKTKEKDDAEA